ncbi:hypothetical protein NCC49_005112 [Naganishia albida]|nr:hypothetical protein NCC49_005112 [Naganishia albida]
MAHALITPTKPTATTTRPAEKVRCKCNHLAKRLTSRSEKNPGRVFYQCYRGRDDPESCKFFVWEDMIPIPREESDPDAKAIGTSPLVARYNASLAAKASPIPKAGNNARGTGVTTQGYTYTPTGKSPLKPITSIPHPPHPIAPAAHPVDPEHRLSSTPDEQQTPLPEPQIPDVTLGAGWNSARKRAMARKRRQVITRAFSARTSDDSLSEESEEEISGHERAPAEGGEEPIEAFESVPTARPAPSSAAGGTRRSDDFDDEDEIAWGQVDVDAMEARASQAIAETPPRTSGDEMARDGSTSALPPYVAAIRTPTTGTRFIERLRAVSTDQGTVSTTKKRKREHDEAGIPPPPPPPPSSEVSVIDRTLTPSFVSACATLTPPETERRQDLGAFSSATDFQGTTRTRPDIQRLSSVTPVNGAASVHVHPLLEALNKDLVRRDRKAAADEKSREMLRGRVKALEGRVRELEAELRRVKSGR